jgi:hypothetical protein
MHKLTSAINAQATKRALALMELALVNAKGALNLATSWCAGGKAEALPAPGMSLLRQRESFLGLLPYAAQAHLKLCRDFLALGSAYCAFSCHFHQNHRDLFKLIVFILSYEYFVNIVRQTIVHQSIFCHDCIYG